MDDDTLTADDELWRGYTGNDGCVTSGAISTAEEFGSGNQDVYVWFILENEKVSVWDPVTTSGGRDVYGFISSPPRTATEPLMDLGVYAPSGDSHGSARVFQFANNAWDFTTRHGGRTMSSRIWADTPAGCPFSDNARSCYNAPTDIAYIREADDGKPDVVGHEYGHFLMDKFYGAGHADETSSVHYFCSATSSSVAWSEGFADWVGSMADWQIGVDQIWGGSGDVLQANGYHMETNAYGTSQCAGTSGDNIEGNVARSLWDLVDTSSDESTDVYYSTVFDIVDDCNHNTFREYYDLGTCSWAGRGNSRTSFKNAALINGINYP